MALRHTDERKRKRPDRRLDPRPIRFTVRTDDAEYRIAVPSSRAYELVPQFPFVDFELIDGGEISISRGGR